MKIATALRCGLLAGVAAVAMMATPAIAQNIRGSATDPTTAKGYGVAFIKQMKDSQQPSFLYHATRGCHFDNYPSDG